jgi:hypothetical protein
LPAELQAFWESTDNIMQKRISNFLLSLKHCGLPLLTKELIEQSARRRTFIVRVVYASLLFFTAFLMFYQELRVGATNSLAVLGKGRELFTLVVMLQFTGIYFFMPAMTCSVVTQEKERASLQLLFLTRLGPWAILFEKLASRVIPMLCFLLLSLPLLAFAYTLGGLTLASLLTGVGLLVLAVIQMGTLALLCSAFFRTTVGAFMWSYLLTIGMFFGPPLVWVLVKSLFGFDIDQYLQRTNLGLQNWGILAHLPLFGMAQFEVGQRFLAGAVWPLAFHAVLVALQSSLCLVLARVFLVRRASLSPRNVVLNVFKILDRIFLRLNNNPLTKGIVFVRDSAALPDQDPVGWRETTKRSLGKGQYLARIFVALEVPIAGLCLTCIFASLSADPLGLLLALLWLVAILMVSVQSASLIAGERSHQTLDVLSSTPLLGRDIIRQKFRSVFRLMLVLAIPFATIFGFTAAMRWNMPDYRYRFAGSGWQPPEFRLGVYLTCSLLTVLIYLPLVAWMSFYIGLRVKTQARAIVAAMGAVLVWCLGPMIFIAMPIEIIFRPAFDSGWAFCLLTSPIGMVGFNEDYNWNQLLNRPWLAMFLNFSWYAIWVVFFRWLCFAQADRLLGRVPLNEIDIDEDAYRRFQKAAAPEPELTEA